MGCKEKEDGLPADVSSSRGVCYLSRAALITQARAKQQLTKALSTVPIVLLTKARSTVPTVLLTCMLLSISSSITLPGRPCFTNRLRDISILFWHQI